MNSLNKSSAETVNGKITEENGKEENVTKIPEKDDLEIGTTNSPNQAYGVSQREHFRDRPEPQGQIINREYYTGKEEHR